MPALVAPVIAFIAGSGIVSLGVSLLASVVVSSLLARKPQSFDRSQQPQEGVRVQLGPNPANKLPVVYGEAWMAPVVIDARLTSDNQYMFYVMAICEVPGTPISVTTANTQGRIGYLAGSTTNSPSTETNIPGIVWGDKVLFMGGRGSPYFGAQKARVSSWLDLNGDGSFNTKPDGKLWVYAFTNGVNTPLYDYYDPWDFNLPHNANAITIMSQAGIPDPWTVAKQASNIAFIIVREKFDSQAGFTGLENMKIHVKGGYNNSTNPASYVYDYPPGDVFVDYMTNKRFGPGLPLSKIDVDSFSANTLANVVSLNTYGQQLITIQTPDGNTSYISRYNIDGPIDTNKQVFDNLNDLCADTDTWLRWNENSGQWSVVVNREILPNDTIRLVTSNNIIGGINISPVDLNTSYNSVELAYPSKKYNDTNQFVTYTLPTSQRSPNEIENVLRESIPQVNDYARAYYLASKRLKQTREDLSIQFKMDYSGIQIDAGDVIAVQHEWYGWTAGAYQPYGGKLFRVSQVKESSVNDNQLTADIQAFPYSPDVYDYATIQDFTANVRTGIGNPSYLNRPTNISISNVAANTSVPNFRLNCTTSNTGLAIGTEFWYANVASGANANISNNATGWSLLATSFAPDVVYAPSTNVSVTISTLPTGNYYLAARNFGDSYKGPFGV